MKKFNFAKLSILKILIIGVIGVLTFSCMSDYEMPPPTYAEFVALHGSSSSLLLPSSSSSVEMSISSSSVDAVSSSSMEIEVSSSSVEPMSSSSSVDVSSSSSSVEVVSSSSVEANVSSSSVEPMGSSSSEKVSSSSADVSSSSLLQSSSSLASSSSSAVPSSSSLAQSSSSVLASVCSLYEESTHFCDKRDGKVYKWVKIGDQDWMAENLNYDVPENMTDVCYNSILGNCNTYGRLYNWATAMGIDASYKSSLYTASAKHRGICPDGWHIPSDAEWIVLTDYVGGASTAGSKLKAASGWNSSGNGTDDYGFSALPGGSGNSSGSFSSVGNLGYWWSSAENNASYAWSRYMRYLYSDVVRYDIVKSNLYSVLCLRD